MNDSESKTYSGWKNYETWNCALWLDNDHGSQEYWRERAEQCVTDSIENNQDDYRDDAIYNLANELKESIEENMPEIGNNLYSDILRANLSEIDYREIASNWIEDIVVYCARYNLAGCLPDSEPVYTIDRNEAIEYLRDAIDSATEDMIESDSELSQDKLDDISEEAKQCDDELKLAKTSGRDCTVFFGGYAYVLTTI